MTRGSCASAGRWLGQGLVALVVMHLALGPAALHAQDFNEPDELLHIMEKSSVRYQVVMTDAVVAEPMAIGQENDPMTYASMADGAYAIATYEFDEVTAAIYKTAEALGIERTNLHKKIKSFGLDREDGSA